MFEPLGVELRWLALAAGDPPPADEFGSPLVVAEPNTAEGARALRDHLTAHFDGAVVNVFAEVAMMNAARFLPAAFRRIAHVHSTSQATLSVAGLLAPHAHALIAPSPGVADRLRADPRVPPTALHHIPHATPWDAGTLYVPAPLPGEPLRLAYLGRIKDEDRGVLLLPAILAECRRLGMDATLSVAGDGPDLAALRKSCRGEPGISFEGELAPGAVPGFLARHHLLLSPANFEGFGLSVLEAMSVGCVPVATNLPGVTDWLLDGGRCGLLFPPHDAGAAARAIFGLVSQGTWPLLSDQARARARTQYAPATIAPRWGDLLAGITAPSAGAVRENSLAAWDIPAELRPHPLAAMVPGRIKSALRRLRR